MYNSETKTGFWLHLFLSKWRLVKSNTVHRGGPEVSKKNLLNSIQSHGHLSQVHIEELLQSKPFLPIRQLPPSQSCGDHHLWSILHNPRHMASSCADNSPNTSYPPRGLRPTLGHLGQRIEECIFPPHPLQVCCYAESWKGCRDAVQLPSSVIKKWFFFFEESHTLVVQVLIHQ
jgi:hypothetical protein